jgi:hypothetical protein
MSEEKNGQHSDVQQALGAAENVALSRRGFVKRAIATAPVIATLPTGAALARSSNVITSSRGSRAKDALGRTLCLDQRSGNGPIAGGVVDLGQPPSGWALAINERDYRIADDSTAAEITEAQMCANGGWYYYDGYSGSTSAEVKKVYVSKGITLSAIAMASFAGSIYVREI